MGRIKHAVSWEVRRFGVQAAAMEIRAMSRGATIRRG